MKRYAIVGTGGRAVMWVDGIADAFRDHSRLVGLCDLSQIRMDWHNRRLADRFSHAAVPTYKADQFDRMIAETQPDVVLVTCTDCSHLPYICRAMELGCDVISEKPITIDAPSLRKIFACIDRTGRSLRVGFNLRYAPSFTAMRDQIARGVVGRPLAVDFSWMLDTTHGADYFRRWHREIDQSGGLLVHKSTHHFDLVNWWLASYPKRVMAMGDLKFYGRKNAEGRGERYAYERYTGEPQAANDPFALRLDQGLGGHEVYEQDALRGLYLSAEKETGYIRDRNVFGDGISVPDTMAVLVQYRSGVIMNYSLIAYSPWEGLRACVTGDRGRIELFVRQTPMIEHSIRVWPMFGEPYDVKIPHAEGSHGGADPLLLEQLLSPHPPADPFGRAASHVDGAASALIGIAANQSIATGEPVEIDQLLRLP